MKSLGLILVVLVSFFIFGCIDLGNAGSSFPVKSFLDVNKSTSGDMSKTENIFVREYASGSEGDSFEATFNKLLNSAEVRFTFRWPLNFTGNITSLVRQEMFGCMLASANVAFYNNLTEADIENITKYPANYSGHVVSETDFEFAKDLAGVKEFAVVQYNYLENSGRLVSTCTVDSAGLKHFVIN